MLSYELPRRDFEGFGFKIPEWPVKDEVDQFKALPVVLEPTDTQAEARVTALHVLYTQARLASLKSEWSNHNPKEVIDGMVQAIPDHVRVYNPDTLHLVQKDEPSPLALYFMSKLPFPPEFKQDDKPKGGLSVLESVHCLRDQVRTKKFLQGVEESVKNLEASSDGTIEVCDAGCGAIPILSIYAALCSDRVRSTALELNSNSAAMARQVVEAFNLQDRITVIEADAITYQPEKPIDLLVSETMHSGLTQEPIVQILSNLQPHVRQEGVTLPGKVSVKAALVNLRDWLSEHMYVSIYGGMHQVFNADWQRIVEYMPGAPLEQIEFRLPTRGLSSGNYLLFVTSDVEVGSGQLTTFQSLISMPQCVRDANGNEAIFSLQTDRDSEISTSYKPGQMLNGVSRSENLSS
jgi:hypothetical protein